MVDMIGKVARAMDPELWTPILPGYKIPRAIALSREISRERAKLAIGAMREPSEAMIDKTSIRFDLDDWHAMIDAALAEPEKGTP